MVRSHEMTCGNCVRFCKKPPLGQEVVNSIMAKVAKISVTQDDIDDLIYAIGRQASGIEGERLCPGHENEAAIDMQPCINPNWFWNSQTF